MDGLWLCCALELSSKDTCNIIRVITLYTFWLRTEV